MSASGLTFVIFADLALAFEGSNPRIYNTLLHLHIHKREKRISTKLREQMASPFFLTWLALPQGCLSVAHQSIPLYWRAVITIHVNSNHNSSWSRSTNVYTPGDSCTSPRTQETLHTNNRYHMLYTWIWHSLHDCPLRKLNKAQLTLVLHSPFQLHDHSFASQII